eukprot:TRINITY_DN26676_c0_g1_i1.p1 TRINITY_DN26676_c0_g1~~TRINITY_DN26676_c0_g1_i1.p1  ORF type:complete len:469 (+),score=40.63 TRINITY_DN26676_c0_g1_i1:127-1407(+)
MVTSTVVLLLAPPSHASWLNTLCYKGFLLCEVILAMVVSQNCAARVVCSHILIMAQLIVSGLENSVWCYGLCQYMVFLQQALALVLTLTLGFEQHRVKIAYVVAQTAAASSSFRSMENKGTSCEECILGVDRNLLMVVCIAIISTFSVHYLWQLLFHQASRTRSVFEGSQQGITQLEGQGATDGATHSVDFPLSHDEIRQRILDRVARSAAQFQSGPPVHSLHGAMHPSQSEDVRQDGMNVAGEGVLGSGRTNAARSRSASSGIQWDTASNSPAEADSPDEVDDTRAIAKETLSNLILASYRLRLLLGGAAYKDIISNIASFLLEESLFGRLTGRVQAANKDHFPRRNNVMIEAFILNTDVARFLSHNDPWLPIAENFGRRVGDGSQVSGSDDESSLYSMRSDVSSGSLTTTRSVSSLWRLMLDDE